MPSITEPLLVLHGDADALIPHSQGQALFELHQSDDKQFVLIKDGQHHLWNTKMPIYIKAAIERFTNQSLP